MTLRLAWLLALVLAMAASPARAQQAAPVEATPERVELTTPQEPVRMLTEDAQRLLGRLREAVEAPAPEPSGGVSRTITLDPPQVVNGSSKFVFVDATQRADEVRASLPLAERRAAVEAYRQSLAAKRGTR